LKLLFVCRAGKEHEGSGGELLRFLGEFVEFLAIQLAAFERTRIISMLNVEREVELLALFLAERPDLLIGFALRFEYFVKGGVGHGRTHIPTMQIA